MAKKIALRIWSVILSSLALITFSKPSHGTIDTSKPLQTVQTLEIKKPQKPTLFLRQITADNPENLLFAGHRSHSSHRSHASHSSHYAHYSGSGGTTLPGTPAIESPSTPSIEPSPKALPSKPSEPLKAYSIPEGCNITHIPESIL